MSTSLSRQLFSHGGVYTVARFANQAITFLLLPLYAHLIGPDGFGIISVMLTVTGFLGFLFLQGLHGAWYRLRFDQQNATELRRFEATIIWYLVGTGVLGLAVLTLFGNPLARLATPGIPYFPLGLLAASTAALLVLPSLYERKLQADQRPLAFAIFSVIRTALNLANIIVFVAVLHRGAAGKIEADAITAGVLAIVAFALLRPASPRQISTPKLKRALAYGWPLIPHNLAGLLNDLIDRLLLNAMLGLGATGVYSMGYQIASVGMLVAMSLNQAFGPIFIRSLKEVERARPEGDEAAVTRLLERVARAGLLMVACVACLLLCLTAAAREALMLLATAEFADSWTVVAPVAAGTFAWACYFPFTQAIAYDVRRVRLMPVITGLAAVVNIGGNLYLIPRFGIMGAAWATLASNTVMALLALIIGQRTLAIPYPWRTWMALTLWVLVGLAALWYLDAVIASLMWRAAAKACWAVVAVWGSLRIVGIDLKGLRNAVLARRVIDS